MTNKNIKKWVNLMCNQLYLEKLIGLPLPVEKIIYKTIADIKDKIEKKWLAEIIIDFLDLSHYPLKKNLSIRLSDFRNGKEINIHKNLKLKQHHIRYSTDSTFKILCRYVDIEKLEEPFQLFYDTSYESMGKLIYKIKEKCPVTFNWYFNGIRQYNNKNNEISHILHQKVTEGEFVMKQDKKGKPITYENKVLYSKKGGFEDEEYEKTNFTKDGKFVYLQYVNLQGGLYPKIVNYILSQLLGKIDIYISNKLLWGEYETSSIYTALCVLKEGGMLIMKIDTDFTIYKMKLLHMISMCFDTFYLENIEKEVFIVCGACKSFIERKKLIDQLQHVLDTNDFTLDTTMPEEIYAILQFFAYTIHYEK